MSTDRSGDRDSDSAPGLWANGEAYATVGIVKLGLQARWSKARVTLLEVEEKAGGTFFGLLAGLHL